jgi:hypothetical protein
LEQIAATLATHTVACSGSNRIAETMWLPSGEGERMKKIHALLTGLSLVIVALSVNRLSSLTENNRLEPYGFLRWLDFNAMLPIPIASIVLYYLLKQTSSFPARLPGLVYCRR